MQTRCCDFTCEVVGKIQNHLTNAHGKVSSLVGEELAAVAADWRRKYEKSWKIEKWIKIKLKNWKMNNQLKNELRKKFKFSFNMGVKYFDTECVRKHSWLYWFYSINFCQITFQKAFILNRFQTLVIILIQVGTYLLPTCHWSFGTVRNYWTYVLMLQHQFLDNTRRN